MAQADPRVRSSLSCTSDVTKNTSDPPAEGREGCGRRKFWFLVIWGKVGVSSLYTVAPATLFYRLLVMAHDDDDGLFEMSLLVLYPPNLNQIH